MQEVTDRDRPEISDAAFERIRGVLMDLKGFNIEVYKDKCVRRRIAIRIRATRCRNAEEYVELLRRQRGESDLLLKVLTIHVSQFFRNPPTFEKLRSEIIPYLLKRGTMEGRGVLTFWSVGCAGGEEPYSLALILKESFPVEAELGRVRILATDIDEHVLNMAREGVYGEERLAEVPATTRERWFDCQGGKYRISPEIRGMVDFALKDLNDREFFPESDLILCRNVLIYFERSHQERILSGFADVLGEGGILVLGKSETLFGAIRSRFQTVCPMERIYRVVRPG